MRSRGEAAALGGGNKMTTIIAEYSKLDTV